MASSTSDEGPHGPHGDDDNDGNVDNDDNEAEPTGVEPVVDADTGEDLGEISGGGGVTDLGGDSPSS